MAELGTLYLFLALLRLLIFCLLLPDNGLNLARDLLTVHQPSLSIKLSLLEPALVTSWRLMSSTLLPGVKPALTVSAQLLLLEPELREVLEPAGLGLRERLLLPSLVSGLGVGCP